MRARTMLTGTAFALSFTACAVPHPPSPGHGFDAVGHGLGQLVLSPFLIVAGLLEGLAALPHFVAADLHELNRNMVASGAAVGMDRTYRYAYGQDFESVPAHGGDGVVFRHMDEATHHFQRVLAGYGVADHRSYLLTAVRTADREGYTLYAVVHRPQQRIRVRDARGRRVVLDAGDEAFYRPYRHDDAGRALDVVIDWAGVPRAQVMTQRGQAVLMTIAANSVLTHRRSDAYWRAEARWAAGGFRDVVAEREAYLQRRMGRTG